MTAGLIVGLSVAVTGSSRASTTPLLQEDEVRALAALARAPIEDTEQRPAESSSGADRPEFVLAHASLRARGLLIGAGWGSAATRFRAIADAIGKARGAAAQRNRDPRTTDTIDVALPFDFQPASGDAGVAWLGSDHRGVRGLEVAFRGHQMRVSPTEMIATNRGFHRQLELIAREWHASLSELMDESSIRTFDAEQVLITLDPVPRAVSTFRGNTLVPLAAVTGPRLKAFARRMERRLFRNVHADGRMTYKYWPSRGAEAPSNNELRQWMATWSLLRVARERNDPRLLAVAERNLRYNLARYYREENGLGIIEDRVQVKLGAVAIAALALLEHPRPAEVASQLRALRATVDRLWQTDGSFRTFLRPTGRNDNENFYPGEALLLWARLYRTSPDADLLARFMQSFRYYRDWHRTHRNPAFVPWHVQAYAIVWQQTHDPALRDWIFEMADWLLAMQRRGPVRYPDTLGEFYDPVRLEYGPPHSSSTGVYLEGLVAAHEVARATDDAERANRYADAIRWGLRSALQNELADAVDLHYWRGRAAIRGGLRTAVFNNAVRVDSVQHTLMGLRSWLERFPIKS